MQHFLDIKNRVAFRRIFGTDKNKEFLISFFNNILEFDKSAQLVDVLFLSKNAALDMLEVLCKLSNGTEMVVAMDVISQGDGRKDAPYISKLCDAQSNKRKELLNRHKALMAIVFMYICNFSAFGEEQGANYINYFTAPLKEPIQGLPKKFSFVIVDLSKFQIKHVENLTDMMQKWAYVLKYAPTTVKEEVSVIAGKDTVIERVYEELNPLNWSEQELQMYEVANKR
ncbi:MAG: PD-(D/E)XK nuclease family transposase [Burkholderiales bacterium]